MVIDKELKAEIERRYNGWDDLCQQLNSAGARLETVKMQRDMVKEQLVTLKTEIKSIGEAIDDPRTDLTMTMSELILEYKQQLADINAAVMHESDVAESYRAEADNLHQQISDSQKREVMLRDWIRQQGEVTNTCTFNILREVCHECACHRAKEQRE